MYDHGDPMAKIVTRIMLIICSTVFVFCQSTSSNTVKIKTTDDGYELLLNEQRYFIKGAGIESHYKELAQYGGNSIRVWGVDQWEESFRLAEKYGFTVCAGMWLEQERQGFDYNDQKAVNAQFERLKVSIQQYKDHPALLMWGVGNELDLNYTNKNVWHAVEQIAAYIHRVDGNHPTMTATAFVEKEEVDLIKAKCPHIDILCINAYAGLPVVAEFVREFGWNKPYILGEWGTMGHWEVTQTSWNEPIELNSHKKALLYKKGYEEYILTDPHCLGGYVFFWGAKQERTPTWYGMFLPTGEKTESVDVVCKLWRGQLPENRSPVLDSLRIDGKNAYANLMVKPASNHTAQVWVHDPDQDALQIKWEILHETTDKRIGGDEEEKPLPVSGLQCEQKYDTFYFRAPEKEGPYRLFAYIYDQYGSAAHANIPFYVIK